MNNWTYLGERGMNLVTEAMPAPALGYCVSAPVYTQSIFSVWEREGKFFYVPFGVVRPITLVGRPLEVRSLEEALAVVQREFEEFYRAEVLFVLSITLHQRHYELTTCYTEEYLVTTDFFERFSLLEFQRTQGRLPGWVCPFLEARGCIIKNLIC